MYSLIGGIFNVNVFLWSNVPEDVERTCILFLTGVSANEIIHFSIYITAFKAGLLVVVFFFFWGGVQKCSVTPFNNESSHRCMITAGLRRAAVVRHNHIRDHKPSIMLQKPRPDTLS